MTEQQRTPAGAEAGAGAVALITGATRGIGRAMAMHLAGEGYSLGLMARGAEELKQLEADLRSRHPGVRIVSLPADVCDHGAVESAVERLLEVTGRVDVAVLCAGVLGRLVSTLESNPSDWANTLAVNVNGSYFAARAAGLAMKSSRARRGDRPGRVLFVSSGAGRPVRTPWGAYAVSKHAVDGLMELMAAEAPQSGVLAASVNPGGTATDMRAQAYPEEDPATLPSAEKVAAAFARMLKLPDDEFNGQRFTARDWF